MFEGFTKGKERKRPLRHAKYTKNPTNLQGRDFVSKYIAVLPLSSITRLALVEAGGRSMAQVKEAIGCQYIINSWFYNMNTGKPVGNLCIDGTVKARANWSGYGLTWDRGPDIRMEVVPGAKAGRSYLSGVELLTPTRAPEEPASYSAEYGGRRGRSAAMLAGDYLVLYCTGDGTADAKTPEAMKDELVELGGKYTNTANLRLLGFDSGGSSQCDFDGLGKIYSSRRVAGYLAVWTKQTGTEPEKEESMGKYTVTPSIGVNIRSGPGTSYGKVGAYPVGTVVDVLEARDGWGRTAKGWVSLAYLEAVESLQRVTDNGIAIQEHIISDGRKNRPGRDTNPDAWITIHETGNPAQGADAEAHGDYLDSKTGETDLVSWHYTVDDHAIVQHLPDGETAYHAGDGRDGPGNTTSIGVELCVNSGGDFAATQANAAALVRLLMAEHGIPIDHVVQHNHWSGKDCPYNIRHTAGAWEGFLALCRGETPAGGVSELDTDVETLAQVDILDDTDYWKSGKYAADTVATLIGNMADYVRAKEQEG